jgi:small subunit ribosomal protein S3Ae
MAKKMLKGKAWFKVLAPEFLGGKSIGETMAIDPETIKGRVINVSLVELDGETQKFYMKVFLKITSMDGTTAKTVFYGHDCTRDFIARIVQARTTRIDTNDIVQLKDGKLRVKAIAICMRPVASAVATAMRKAVSAKIAELASQQTLEEFVVSFLGGEMQNVVRREMNKVYPLRAFELRKTEIV